MQERLPVLKTYKIYIGGKFERSESGRYYPLADKKGTVIANICLSSKKDVKNALVSARSAFAGWSHRSAYNRSQILYRIAEMMEGRKAQFAEELRLEGLSAKAAESEVLLAVDRMVYYAGWCDKISQVFGTINPVASPHFNFSVPEPMGVVAILAPAENTLSGLITAIAPVIASGNSCVVLADEKHPLSSLTLTEVLATSDLPGGVVNILTGSQSELLDVFATHMDINAVACHGVSSQVRSIIQQQASLNVRRPVFYDDRKATLKQVQNPYRVMDFTEIKTTWHPIGI